MIPTERARLEPATIRGASTELIALRQQVQSAVEALTDINRVLSGTRTTPTHLVGADIEWCISHARLALSHLKGLSE